MTVHVPVDRVWETSTSTGTGNFTPAGAAGSGYRTFASALPSDTPVHYTIEGVTVASEFETGWGTWNGSALTRDTVKTSSNSNALVSFSAGTKNMFVDIIASDVQVLANHLYVKAHFGAKGDGTTDDSTAIGNAIAAVAADRGQILYFEPGVYSVPSGISESKTGLVVIGLGHIGIGPGAQQTGMGVILHTTGTGAWCWQKVPGASGNEYRGGRFHNIGFQGDADTAGGLLIKTCSNIIENCVSIGHTIGMGFQVLAPDSPGDSATFNRFHYCMDVDSLIGFQIGSSTSGGAAYSRLNECVAVKYSVGGISHTGRGVRMYDDGSSIIGGHFESHDVGVECLQGHGTRIIGTMFEDNNTWDISLARPSGTSGTRNLLIVTTSKINVGAFNVGDVIVGGDSNFITDAGDTTLMFQHETVKIPRSGSATAPTGGYNGQIVIQNGRLYYNDGGTWLGLLGT